jgi:ketosteroid isomerase-like protein
VEEESPEIQAIRHVYEIWNRGDIAAFTDALHPEISWRSIDFDAEERTFNGRDEVREFLEKFVSQTGTSTLEPEKLIQVGERVVVPLVSRDAEADAAAPEMQLQMTAMWTLLDGLPVAFRLFFDTEKALASARGSSAPCREV